MKDSGRFFLAILLMIAVIVGSNMLFRPDRPEVAAPAPELVTDLPQGVGVGPASVEVAAAGAGAAGSGAGVAGPSIGSRPAVQADTIEVNSPLYRYSISTRGAAVVGAELHGFESATEAGVVDLVPEGADGLIGYSVRLADRTVNLRDLEFTPEQAGSLALQAGDAARTLWFAHRDAGSGFTVRIGYTFSPDDYLVRVQGEVLDAAQGGNRHLLVELGPTLASHERDTAEDLRSLAFVVNGPRDGIRSVPLRDVKAERVEEGPLQWVALKNKYFLAAVLGNEGAREGTFGGVIARPTGEANSAALTTTLPLSENGSFEYRVYMGPQEHSRLAAIGDGLQDVNPYGWKILRPIIRPLGHLITWALVGLHSTLNLAYGWVLILFGVLIRLVLWPLNARAMRAQMRNMALQPRLKEIQEKYKKEPERLQQEMLRLYKEEGFNPLGGCLPMLIPFPVLITLFFVFQNTIEFRGTGFLWLADLSAADPFFILPIVLGLSMLLMQVISMRSMPPNPQTKMLTYVMPVMMTVIFFKLASGLNLYYAAQNLASIPQQLQIARERKRQQEAQRQPARAR
jgi:YidC/Oxa1 family membrane protein insertase